MLNKILVAMDESASSQWAFETALEIAQGTNAHLILVHVLDVFTSANSGQPSILFGNGLMEVHDDAQKDYERQWAQHVHRYDELLQQKQAEAEAIGVTATYLQPQGRPGPAICKVAEMQNIDLVVVGNRDRSNLKELVLGSVSNYLVHHAPCSVTVIHPNGHDKAIMQADSSEFSPIGIA